MPDHALHPKGGTCRACSLAVRDTYFVLRDVADLPRSTAIVVGTPAAAEAFDARVRAIAHAKLTRLQFELAGYCYACAFRGELLASGDSREPVGRDVHEAA